MRVPFFVKLISYFEKHVWIEEETNREAQPSKDQKSQMSALLHTIRKRRPEYTPATDFYKRFRETVVEMHEQNLPTSILKGVLDGITHTTKKEHYPEIVDG